MYKALPFVEKVLEDLIKDYDARHNSIADDLPHFVDHILDLDAQPYSVDDNHEARFQAAFVAAILLRFRNKNVHTRRKGVLREADELHSNDLSKGSLTAFKQVFHLPGDAILHDIDINLLKQIEAFHKKHPNISQTPPIELQEIAETQQNHPSLQPYNACKELIDQIDRRLKDLYWRKEHVVYGATEGPNSAPGDNNEYLTNQVKIDLFTTLKTHLVNDRTLDFAETQGLRRKKPAPIFRPQAMSYTETLVAKQVDALQGVDKSTFTHALLDQIKTPEEPILHDFAQRNSPSFKTLTDRTATNLFVEYDAMCHTVDAHRINAFQLVRSLHASFLNQGSDSSPAYQAWTLLQNTPEGRLPETSVLEEILAIYESAQAEIEAKAEAASDSGPILQESDAIGLYEAVAKSKALRDSINAPTPNDLFLARAKKVIRSYSDRQGQLMEQKNALAERQKDPSLSKERRLQIEQDIARNKRYQAVMASARSMYESLEKAYIAKFKDLEMVPKGMNATSTLNLAYVDPVSTGDTEVDPS